MNRKARVIALYLPQFHPIPENDHWWGKGFTEWTNVGKARALFTGHYQPRVPADLGYYDLRVPETRKAQADMAREYGVEGFCYWHYWFGNGKQLLERPFQDVLQSKELDFPFCLAWANESWKGLYHGLGKREVLIEQLYPSEQDYIDHFYKVLPAFKDDRYIKVGNKPLFLIFQPFQLPDASAFITLWQNLAKENGLAGIHFIGQIYDATLSKQVLDLGFDAVNVVRLFDYKKKRRLFPYIWRKIRHQFLGYPRIIPYKEAMQTFVGQEEKQENIYPSIIPNWDHTPRTGNKGLVFHNSTPELFARHLKEIETVIADKSEENKIVFIKSWNEWAEGNYMEPDLRYGIAYLQKLREFIVGK